MCGKPDGTDSTRQVSAEVMSLPLEAACPLLSERTNSTKSVVSSELVSMQDDADSP